MTALVPTKNGGGLAAYGTSADIKALDDRLKIMLPGADKLNQGQRLALCQAAIAHGLDPLNGELWMIPGRGLMVGIKGLRKKAHNQVRGNFWVEFRIIATDEEKKLLRIPPGSLAYEAKLFDTENITTYTEAVSKLMKAGVPWDAVERMVGSKPYTVGLGVLKPGEQTKMEPTQCAMKRAEADAIKRRFDVGFGVEVSDDEPTVAGFVVEAEVTETDTTEQDKTESKARREADKAALFPAD